MNSLNSTFKLANGNGIPCIGFGTWQTPDGTVAVDSIRTALEVGYRHIDTAAIYKNEVGVGEGVRAGLFSAGLSREDVFVTSKLWNTDRGYDATLAAFDATMERLHLDYLDLYLIHWPAAPHQFADWERINAETWHAFEDLYMSGRVRAIGVSNFTPFHLESLFAHAHIVPMVNQIEYHIGFNQRDTVDFCNAHNIVVEAWSPLGQGRLLDQPVMKEVADCHNVTPAQVAIRWCLQQGTLPLPKSVHADRIASNGDVFSFELTDADMAALDTINVGRAGGDPDTVEF